MSHLLLTKRCYKNTFWNRDFYFYKLTMGSERYGDGKARRENEVRLTARGPESVETVVCHLVNNPLHIESRFILSLCPSGYKEWSITSVFVKSKDFFGDPTPCCPLVWIIHLSLQDHKAIKSVTLWSFPRPGAGPQTSRLGWSKFQGYLMQSLGSDMWLKGLGFSGTDCLTRIGFEKCRNKKELVHVTKIHSKLSLRHLNSKEFLKDSF